MKHIVLTLAALVLPFPALAEVLSVQSVTPGIWAIEGPAEQRDAQNLGNNATFGLIETADGQFWSIQVAPGPGPPCCMMWCAV